LRQPDGRCELVAGRIVAVAPERARHNLTKLAVAMALRDGVKRAALPCTVFTDGMTVVIDKYHAREPDAAIQGGDKVDPEALKLDAPVLVVEVVSPSSERDDTGAKLVEYFSVASIRHYLIVNAEKRVIIHHARQGADIHTRIVGASEELQIDPPGFARAALALLGEP
jgi:Uma2 family endonuclease